MFGVNIGLLNCCLMDTALSSLVCCIMRVILSSNIGAFTPHALRESLVGESYLYISAFFSRHKALFNSETFVNIFILF